MLRTLLAGGVCEGDLWEELVAVYRSRFADQTHTMEVVVGAASAVASLGEETEQGTCKCHRQRSPPSNHERMLYLMAEQ